MKLSKYQKQILNKMRRGSRITVCIGGCYMGIRKIRDSTVEALHKAGLIVLAKHVGKRMTTVVFVATEQMEKRNP